MQTQFVGVFYFTPGFGRIWWFGAEKLSVGVQNNLNPFCK